VTPALRAGSWIEQERDGKLKRDRIRFVVTLLLDPWREAPSPAVRASP